MMSGMIEEWLGNLRSESTKRVYLAGLQDFIGTVLEEEDFNAAIKQYLTKIQNGHDPFKDLLTYATSLADRKTPPTTANAYVNGVKRFFEFTVDLDFSRKQNRQIRNAMPKGKRARTIEGDLTRNRLRKILTHCDTKGKALFLFLESSGIRAGEALQLELDEIDLKSELIKVNVRGEYTKTGDPYYSFISKEAKDALEEWLKIRGDYLLTSAKRGIGLSKFKDDGRGEKLIEDNRIFPFSQSVANSMWNIALRKAGLSKRDKGTNRRTLHIHMLRKFFSSQLRIVVPRAIVEMLMEHEEGLDDAYRRYSETQIREWYLKGAPHLYVFVPQEITKIQTKFADGLLNQQAFINGLQAKNLRLEEDLERQKKKVEELSKTVDNLSKIMENKIAEVFSKEWKKHMRKLYEEDREALKQLREERETFTKRREEETKISEKPSDTAPKKEPSFLELIYGIEEKRAIPYPCSWISAWNMVIS